MGKSVAGCNFIAVTGGVLSGLGKGTAAASIGLILESQGFKVIPVKCDGYLNVDPGTMSPTEHGEVFVLDDGGETDMDFGHYERFLNVSAKSHWNLTTGKIFQSLIEKERKGEFLGKTVQMIPHATGEIKECLYRIVREEKPDFLIVEVGGTVGDIENMLFLEALREVASEIGRERILFTHLVYIPLLDNVKEQKTKPAQQSVNLLREKGIFPELIIGRSKDCLTEKSKEKISLFCNVAKEAVISAPDVKCIYKIPLNFERDGILDFLGRKFKFKPKRNLKEWKNFVEKVEKPEKNVRIAIVGKYTALHDSYASITEALTHAGAACNARVGIEFVETTDEGKVEEQLNGIQGVIVPGGFGSRGSEGKIKAIEYCRKQNIPFLGLCFGLQLAVIEFARNVCKLQDSNSTEINSKTGFPVIDILPEQRKVRSKGATMRLGAFEAVLKRGSKVRELYDSEKASERHRHRFEVNPEFHEILQENGMVFSGTSCNGRLVEFIELPEHKFFIATQAHPELKSKLGKPAPLFYGLVKAALQVQK